MIELRLQAGHEAARALARIKLIASEHPGHHQLAILAEYVDRANISIGPRGEAVIPKQTRRLELGPLWTYDAGEACLAALGEFGAVARR